MEKYQLFCVRMEGGGWHRRASDSIGWYAREGFKWPWMENVVKEVYDVVGLPVWEHELHLD